jgi:hypothetical protein
VASTLMLRVAGAEEAVEVLTEQVDGRGVYLAAQRVRGVARAGVRRADEAMRVCHQCCLQPPTRRSAVTGVWGTIVRRR